MPIECIRDDTARRFTAITTGEVSLQETLRFAATYRIGDYRTYTLLCDVREGTIRAAAEEVAILADRVCSLVHAQGPRGRMAILTADPASYGIARMFQIRCEASGVETVNVFSAIAEAEAWLDGGE